MRSVRALWDAVDALRAEGAPRFQRPPRWRYRKRSNGGMARVAVSVES